MKLTSKELQQLERQLSCPDGDVGIEVGKQMHASNIGMTINTIEFLNIKAHNKILEIGHGNGEHIPKLIEQYPTINYSGLELSKAMFNAANNNAGNYNSVKLFHYNGDEIPFPSESFDLIYSVNTIYFWKEPQRFFMEIYRCLKQGASLVLTFADKAFMRDLPFVGNKFKLYTPSEVRELASNVGLNFENLQKCKEKVVSKSGEDVERIYYMIKMRK